MTFKSLIVLLICCCFYGCSDYAEGYKDGYTHSEKQQWLIIGRATYLDGYDAGVAEKFQQDWVAQNLPENTLHCPEVTFRADPLMFLPVEYKRTGIDIYQIDHQ